MAPDDQAAVLGGHEEGEHVLNGDAPVTDPKVVTSLADLASIMTMDENLAIFRRFEEFSLLNLLILQDQIQKMTDEFKNLCSSNAEPDAADGVFLASYGFNRNPPAVPQGESEEAQAKKKAELLKHIRLRVKEYDSALFELAQLRNLEPPDGNDVVRLQRHIREQPEALRLPSGSSVCWGDANREDLAVLRSDINKGNRVINWLRFAVDTIRWELWGHRTAETAQGNVISVGKPQRHVSKSERAKKSAATSRLFMALFGGIALIVPTVIMAKKLDLNTSLITTSVATVLFAAILALGATDSTGKDVLAATAAYTAVLVVFVGTSVASTSSGSGSSGG